MRPRGFNIVPRIALNALRLRRAAEPAWLPAPGAAVIYKDRGVDVKQVGRDLGVRYVVRTR